MKLVKNGKSYILKSFRYTNTINLGIFDDVESVDLYLLENYDMCHLDESNMEYFDWIESNGMKLEEVSKYKKID